MIWEFDLLNTATWLTHFDEFTRLPRGFQMQLLQSIWHVWGRLYKVVETGRLRKTEELTGRHVQICNKYCLDLDKAKVETSWFSPYPLEQIQYFLGADKDGKWQLDDYIQPVSDLKLTDVELTFMFAQLCFQHAGSRFLGEIKEVTDRFVQILANDLHDYYSIEKRKSPNYAGRLARILKINQGIQSQIRGQREKAHIALTFDIFTADFSHPEMFSDTGC
ncbi:unnamed protein product [Caenorhabditis sp. 36 PRJEB53466]|nr:unnamed protein product [Caenorhabditis sp. 36 PRJEB53466]